MDVLEMVSHATITGKTLIISSKTVDNPSATHFGTSYWRAGVIQSQINLVGEDSHRLTLSIGFGNTNLFLEGNMEIQNQYVTVEWTGSNVQVAAKVVVDNKGTFIADSPGREMGSVAGLANRWNFANKGDLILKRGAFNNIFMTEKNAGHIYKRAVGAVFQIDGKVAMLDPGTGTTVEEGTLLVSETFDQFAGHVSLLSGTTLDVDGAYTIDAGTISNLGYDTLLQVGSYTQNGGALDITTGATLASDGSVTFHSGTAHMETNAKLSAAGYVSLLGDTVATLAGTITAVELNNAATLNIGETTNGSDFGRLVVLGNYRQTGALNLNLRGSNPNGDNLDYLSISGTAYLGGSLNISYLDGYMATPGMFFRLVGWGARDGYFAAVNPPPLNWGSWQITYSGELVIRCMYY